MSETTIRAMTVADIDRVSELAGELGYDVSPVEVAQRIGSQPEDGVALVAVCDGEVAGWIHGLDRRLLQYPRVLEVGGLVVGEQYRGRGIGKGLIDAITAWGAEHGHSRIFVHSNVVRDGAHQFYEDLGFEPIFYFSVEPWIFYSQTVVVLAIALILSFYPVLKLFRLDPVRAMRK